VLKFCGSADRVAAKFHEQLAAIYEMVSSHGSKGSTDDGLSEAGNEDRSGQSTGKPHVPKQGSNSAWPAYAASQNYLFHIPADADAARVNLALSLFFILSQPFGDPSSSVSAEANAADNWLGDPSRHEYPQMAAQPGWDHESRLLFGGTSARSASRSTAHRAPSWASTRRRCCPSSPLPPLQRPIARPPPLLLPNGTARSPGAPLSAARIPATGSPLPFP
jgi:hypothetical protein